MSNPPSARHPASSEPESSDAHSANDEQREVRLAVLGLPAFECQVLARIFVLSSVRRFKYVLCPPGDFRDIDAYIVDADSAQAMSDWQTRRRAEAGRGVACVFLGRSEPAGDGHYLRRPLVASRVLKLLDHAVSARPGRRPDASAAAAAGRPATAAADGPRERAATGYSALVVDDSLAVRRQVGLALRNQGIAADLAASGAEALDLIGRRAYDVIFLDVVMPGMDGYGVCREIKRNRDRKHIPVVMLTGKSSPFDKVKGRLAGCDTYLTKPVKLSLFKQTLERLLPNAVQPD